jgi:hypothetical protein
MQLISKNFDGLASWNNGSGLNLQLQLIGKLLDPTKDESSAIYVGDIICKLILKVLIN